MAMQVYDAPTPDYGSLLRLDGRCFAVLGAGNGMGRQTAIALASQGARVLCVDVDRERAEHVAAEVGGVAHVADVTPEITVPFNYAVDSLSIIKNGSQIYSDNFSQAPIGSPRGRPFVRGRT